MIDPAKLTYTMDTYTVRFSDGIEYPRDLFAELACERAEDRAAVHAVMKKFNGALIPCEVKPLYDGPGLTAALLRMSESQGL